MRASLIACVFTFTYFGGDVMVAYGMGDILPPEPLEGRLVGECARSDRICVSDTDCDADDDCVPTRFGGLVYIQYDGVIEGETAGGPYRVSYTITAPANPNLGNGATVVEPSHLVGELRALYSWLGEDFLLGQRFAHAGISWSTQWRNMVDSDAPGLHIHGFPPVPLFQGGVFERDDGIIIDFARALQTDEDARRMVGDNAARRYLTGFSNSAGPVKQLLASGAASGVFDFALPMTSGGGPNPRDALAAGAYDGFVIAVFEEHAAGNNPAWWDDGSAPDHYRFYAVAGTPHVADDPEDVQTVPPVDGSTPASWQQELRARFWQGHLWVKSGGSVAPPESTQLAWTPDDEIERDGQGNARSVYASGEPAPRLPYVELGEATFVGGFIGSITNVASAAALGFDDHADYLEAFEQAVAQYRAAGNITEADAREMRQRAALCPPFTFTETYVFERDRFNRLEPCP